MKMLPSISFKIFPESISTIRSLIVYTIFDLLNECYKWLSVDIIEKKNIKSIVLFLKLWKKIIIDQNWWDVKRFLQLITTFPIDQ